MIKTNYPTREELQECFELRVDSKGNETLWRRHRRTTRYGKKGEWALVESKKNTSRGYCKLGFLGKSVYYHVAVYILHHGSIPEGLVIDHVDGYKLNNRVENLRAVTSRANSQNRVYHREGQEVGICHHHRLDKWEASISVGGNRYSLGCYSSRTEASTMYQKACELLAEGVTGPELQEYAGVRTKARCTSKYVGVYRHKRLKKWIARATLRGTRKHIGLYDTAEEAHEARCKYLEDLNADF